MRIRNIRKVVSGKHTTDGAGVNLVRVIGRDDVKDFDPFLMLDAFDSYNSDDYIKGFPWHPHRGIETVTYLIEGEIEHGDSLGNKGTILSGDCQWMTAGSGIVHQEMPQESKRMLGVQLWINLPAKNKMTDPKYRDITIDNIPILKDKGSIVKIICGEFMGITGATQGDYNKPLFLDVEVSPYSKWSAKTDNSSTVFIYIIEGEGAFGSKNDIVSQKHAVLFDEGETFQVKTSESGIRFLLFSGMPLKEPVAWGGPIVMNTQEELDLAFKEIKENIFIKHK